LVTALLLAVLPARALAEQWRKTENASFSPRELAMLFSAWEAASAEDPADLPEAPVPEAAVLTLEPAAVAPASLGEPV